MRMRSRITRIFLFLAGENIFFIKTYKYEDAYLAIPGHREGEGHYLISDLAVSMFTTSKKGPPDSP